jgi:transcriptional regulator with XRE-family HTH domain
MTFKDRLREKRVQAGLTQVELAKKAEVSDRTIQNYELGTRKPKSLDIVEKLAAALGTTAPELLGSAGMYYIDAQEKGGAKAAKDIDELVSEVAGMFAGGELPEDALDGAMRALNEAYWLAKDKNKKYAPKKYREQKAE